MAKQNLEQLTTSRLSRTMRITPVALAAIAVCAVIMWWVSKEPTFLWLGLLIGAFLWVLNLAWMWLAIQFFRKRRM